MEAEKPAKNLEGLLEELDEAADENRARVNVEEVIEAIGRRSFGPLLLLGGILGMTPIAAIPTAPSIIALITILISVQLLFGRDTIWLPRFLLKLSVKSERLKKTVRMAQKPAHSVDKVVKPRLQMLTRPLADRVVAATCIVIACAVPPLELLPLAALIPSAAIAAFGLGLVVRDGLVVLVAFLISATVIGLAAYKLIGG